MRVLAIAPSIILLFGLAAGTAWGKAATTAGHASELFSVFQERVFQIRVIDKSSGKKSAIGSGFSIDSNGLFATNYHVVSDLVIEPKRYRLEYVAFDGASGPARRPKGPSTAPPGRLPIAA